MQNAKYHSPHDMFFLVVSNFVRHHGDNFRNGLVRNKSIEQGNPFVFSKSDEEGIRFAGTLGSIHYINVFKSKANRSGVIRNCSF